MRTNFLNFVPEGSFGLEFPYDSSLEGFIGETNIEKEDEKENAKEDENDSVEGLLALHLDGQWLSPLPRLTASQKVHLPFDMLTALSKAEGRRCASSFVTAAYFYVRLIPQDLRALYLDLFSLPSDFNFLQ
jgi:hypothetical protein